MKSKGIKKLYDYNSSRSIYYNSGHHIKLESLKDLKEPVAIRDCNDNSKMCEYVEALIEEERTTS